MALTIDTPLRPKASTRRWRSRARLAAAVMASLLLHWLLQQGLARTVIDVRPLDGLFPDQEPSYRPELATDFPLHDESSTREAFAHERPLDVPIAIDAAAPASARGAIRDGERAVAEMPLEEGVEEPQREVLSQDHRQQYLSLSVSLCRCLRFGVWISIINPVNCCRG
jgi:hypothetical protein